MAAHFGASIPHVRNDVITFTTGAESYLRHGGEARYLPPILEHLGERPIASITPFDIRQMAVEMLPIQSNATRNRQALAPARAVMIHSYERGWCPLMRLPRFKQEPPRRKTPASIPWLQIFVRQCDIDKLPHLAALVMFMSLTGARISEAVNLRWHEVDLMQRRVMLLKTKTAKHSPRSLTDALAKRLLALGGSDDPERHVFRYTSRYSVNERIAAVCNRAGISYKSPHLCGRHSFATNAMAMGADLREAMDAGGWKSSGIFIETYVHVHEADRLVANRFNGISFDVDI